MAEKKLQTRIINKHDLLTAWETSNLQLKEGEIALAKVMVAQKDGTEAPTYVAKIGIAGKTFNESPMLFAPASDVYEWAKASAKPGYNATEIVRGTSNVEADLTVVEEAVATLQGLVGSDVSVADAIKSAIEALDVEEVSFGAGKVVSAIKQVDGKITVTSRDLEATDIPTLSIEKIDGLQTALDAKADKTTTEEAISAINSDIAAAQAYAEGIYKAGEGESAATGILATYMTENDAEVADVRAIAEAAQTAEEVATAISGFNTSTVAPLAERVTAVEGVAAQNTTDIANETTRATGVEAGLDSRLQAAESAISTLNAATTFAGTGTYAEMNTLENVKSGSIFVVVDNTESGKQYNNKEFVYDGSKWVELGDTTAELQEITYLKGRMDAVESKNGTQDTAIGDAQAAADAAQASADAIYKVTDGTASGVLADEIARATQAESDTLATAKAYAEEKASDAETAANGYTDGKIATVNESIETLSSTVSTNAETAATATKKVADDLDAYVTSNDAAVAAAQKAGDDAQKTVDDLAAGAVAENTEGVTANASAIASIQATYARVEGDKLVYGQGEEVLTIIFDCGGATE